MIGFVGFPLDDVSKFTKKLRSQINFHIVDIEHRLEMLKLMGKSLKNPANTLLKLIPVCFLNSEIDTIEDCIQNSNLSEMENTFFFEKWHQILSQINKYQKMEDIKRLDSLRTKNPSLFVSIRNEIRVLKRFVIDVYHNVKTNQGRNIPYSTKTRLNKLIQEDNSAEIIAKSVSDLSSLILIRGIIRKPYNHLLN